MNDTWVLSILQKRGPHGRLISRERNDLEFKKSYSRAALPKYAKTLAAFANNKGGTIVFGINDTPRTILGVDASFCDIQSDSIAGVFNSLFAPELHWMMNTVQFEGKTIGYIYVFEADKKPIIAQKNDNSGGISSGDVFYRYNGRSEKIHFAEMRKIIDDEVKKERDHLFRTLTTIVKSSTANIGIIDYDAMRVATPDGANFVLDRKLVTQILRKAKYIKEGSFNQTDGMRY